MTQEITSLQNPKIKMAAHLKERRDREKSGLFLIEGYRELIRAFEGGVSLKTLFICEELFLGSNETALINQIKSKGAEVLKVTPSVFKKFSYRDRPDGLVAVAYQMKHTLQTLFPILDKSANPFFVVAESIEKPGNLGTILRSSDAVGVDGVIVCDKCTDIYNPNVVRASTGTLFTIPVVESEGEETLQWLKRNKVQVVAATPSAKRNYTEADFTAPIAIAVGTEQLGLSDLWMEASDIHVSIPMMGVADSLNVASATTILLYEVLRQRKLHEKKTWK